MNICLPGSSYDLLHAGLLLIVTVLDVVSNGSVEEHRFLGDNANLGSDMGQVQLLDVVVLHVQGASVQIIEPLYQLDHGGLATPGLAHQSNPLSRLDMERDLVEDLGVGSGGVAELTALQPNVPLQGVVQLEARRRVAVYQRLSVQNLKYFVCGKEQTLHVQNTGEGHSHHHATGQHSHCYFPDVKWILQKAIHQQISTIGKTGAIGKEHEGVGNAIGEASQVSISSGILTWLLQSLTVVILDLPLTAETSHSPHIVDGFHSNLGRLLESRALDARVLGHEPHLEEHGHQQDGGEEGGHQPQPPVVVDGEPHTEEEGHEATQSSCHHVIMSSCRHVVMSSCHHVIQ